MANARGIFQRFDLSPVQELCLQTYLARNETKALEKEISSFEQQLMLHRPEVYEKYMEDKKEKEALGYDHVVWKTPESLEEAEFLLDIITKTNKQINNEEKFGEDEEDNSPEMNFLKQFEGIDISQLGGLDG